MHKHLTTTTRRIAVAAAVTVVVIPVGFITSAHALLGGLWYR